MKNYKQSLCVFYKSQKLGRWYVTLHAQILCPANSHYVAEIQSLTSTQFVYILLKEQ